MLLAASRKARWQLESAQDTVNVVHGLSEDAISSCNVVLPCENNCWLQGALRRSVGVKR